MTDIEVIQDMEKRKWGIRAGPQSGKRHSDKGGTTIGTAISIPNSLEVQNFAIRIDAQEAIAYAAAAAKRIYDTDASA